MTSERDGDLFDYVVIGGGTAGLTLAVRLSEDPSLRVCVLEAGKHYKGVPEIDRPGYQGRLLFNPEYDWNFESTPQPHANGRKIGLNRGKMLGGSSGLNFMVLGRPSSMEYDALEKLGNPGWGWESLLPYLKKAETTHPWPSKGGSETYKTVSNPEYHGYDGPIHASVPPWFHPLRDPFVETLVELGVPINTDQDDGNNLGINNSPTAINPKTGTRSYSANAYYEPVADRQNLVVLTEAHVTKVLFTPERKPLVATGVEYMISGTGHIVHASREVILSAGTLQTPQILELSGIGRRDILEKIGLEVLLESPGVGKNLRDHNHLNTLLEVDESVETVDKAKLPEVHAQQETLYKEFSGMYASTNSLITWLSLDHLGIQSKERLLALEQSLKVDAPALREPLKIQSSWLNNEHVAHLELIHVAGGAYIADMDASKTYITVISAIQHPFSRGSVHASSSDPFAAPLIDVNYYAEPIDLALAVEGLKFVDRLAQTEPLKSHIRRRAYPTPEQLSNDKQLEQYARENVTTVWHYIGSASMLPLENGGVVDSQLRVYGTANLRVVDLSVLPIHLACHPQATVYAIAEKAADMIRGVKSV